MTGKDRMTGKKVTRVCVVTVCLNARDAIRLTLESVKRQSFAAVDHVIIDGKSSDGTLDIVADYEVAKVISEKDGGVYQAMDKGAKAATGDIAIFLNAGDTFFDEHVCRDIATFFDETQADMVFGNLMPVYLRSGDRHDHGSFEAGRLVDGSSVRDLAQLYDSSIHHQATFYRTDLLKKVSYKCERPEGTGEYNLLLDAVMRQKASVKYCNRTISRFPLGGISTRDFKVEWQKYVKGREALRELYFNGHRPTTGVGFFVHAASDRFAQHPAASPALMAVAPPSPMSPSLRAKIAVKSVLKNSIFFRLYDRLARSIAYRGGQEVLGPFAALMEARFHAVLDYRLGPVTQALAVLDQKVAKTSDLAMVPELVRHYSQQTLEGVRNYGETNLENIRHYGQLNLNGVRDYGELNLETARRVIADLETRSADLDRTLTRVNALLAETLSRQQNYLQSRPFVPSRYAPRADRT